MLTAYAIQRETKEEPMEAWVQMTGYAGTEVDAAWRRGSVGVPAGVHAAGQAEGR